MIHSRTGVLLLASTLLAACGPTAETAGGRDFGGTLIIATGGEAKHLLPPFVYETTGKAASDMLFEPLAMVSDDLDTMGDKSFEPRLADRWEWAEDSMSIAFHIDPRARWHDGRPVVAADVKYTFDLVMDPETRSFVAPNLRNIDSVTVRDSSVAVAWYRARSPEQFFQLVGHLNPIPSHVFGGMKTAEVAQSAAARAPVGNGPFRFARWVPQATLELVADTANWRKRPKLDRLIWSTRADPNAAMASVLTGESDFIEVLRGDAIKQIATSAVARPVSRPASDYGVMIFRVRDGAKGERPHPVLGDRDVRRALTMAIDRPTLARSVLDTLALPGMGPLTRTMLGADTSFTQLAYDVEGAKRLLEGAGWRDDNGDGVREKGGKPLAFSIMAPSSSTVRQLTATILQGQLEKVGAKVDISSLEGNTMQSLVGAGKFDAVLLGMVSDPSRGSLAQDWGTGAALTGDGSNFSMYMNPALDAVLDSASHSFDTDVARRHYHRALELLIADAPAVWLYETKGSGAINRRVRPAVMRADAWWAHLDDWSIDRSMAIARDSIGLRPINP